MTNEDFRRELGQTLDDMTGSPSAALRDRVRSSLADVPESRGPFWIAGIAAALMAAIVVGLLVVANLNRHQTSLVPGSEPSARPSASASPDSNLPAFTCQSSSQTFDSVQIPPVALVGAVRLGTHPGYDRLTIEFKSGHPTGLIVDPRGTATFTEGASGRQVTLAGSAGLLVTIHGADEHTGFSGPLDLKPGYPMLLEARQVQDFESTVQWGLGLSKGACYRAFFIEGPTRLVIDVQAG